MLTYRAVTLSYGTTTILDAIDLTIADGEFVALVGASGAGKTTLLKLANRLVESTGGTVEVDGRDVRSVPVHDLRRGIGYAFQGVGLFPHMTVAENIAAVPRLLGWDARRQAARVAAMLDLVELPQHGLSKQVGAEPFEHDHVDAGQRASRDGQPVNAISLAPGFA